MAKEITLQDIVNLIEAQNKRFDQIDARFEQVDARFDQVESRFEKIDSRFEQVDARFDDIKRDTSGIRLEQTKLNKLYGQIFDRVCGIESDITEIYDRLVIIEEKLPNLTEAEYTETQTKVEKLYYWAYKVSRQTNVPLPK